MTIEERVKQQFPTLFITLVSVLIGLFFADLVSEARSRMTLWPLDWSTLRTWGQIVAMAANGFGSWLFYSHIGISRQRVAHFSDSVVAFGVTTPLLISNTFVGRADIWPWFYCASIYLVFATLVTVWQIQLALTEPELAPMRKILRPDAKSAILVVGIFVFGLAGFLDQRGLLSLPVEALLALGAAPAALGFAWLFFRDWHDAIAEASRIQRSHAPRT